MDGFHHPRLHPQNRNDSIPLMPVMLTTVIPYVAASEMPEAKADVRLVKRQHSSTTGPPGEDERITSCSVNSS